jgi:hypothetical protein
MAAFRIACGLMVFLSVVSRFGDLAALYSDNGICPRIQTITLSNVPEWWSVYMVSGTEQWAILLFVLTAVFGLMLAAGCRTGFAAFMSWAMIISMQNRSPMVLDGQDIVLRVLLLFGMLLPWGQFYSVDRMLSSKPRLDASKPYCDMTTVAILVQSASILFVSALLKDDRAWRITGEASMYSLNVDFLTTHVGVWLTQFPQLLREASFINLYWEAVGVLFLFSPFPTLRLFGVFGYWLTWFLVGITNRVDLLPYVCAIAYIPFIPGAAWNALGAMVGKEEVFQSLRRRWAYVAAGAGGGSDANSARNCTSGKAKLFVLEFAASFFLVIATIWNANTIDKHVTVPDWVYRVAMTLRLDQNWFFWAHFIPQLNGWYVMPATLANGKVVDVFRGGKPLDWSRPLEISADYPNRRWSIFLIAMFNDSYKAYRPYYVKYICSEWNKCHIPEERIMHLQVFYMYEGPLPEINLKDRVAQKVTVWEYSPDAQSE